VESAFLWRLSRPHRHVQTTLSTPAARTLPTNQPATARLRIRLPMELQGSESERRDTKVTSPSCHSERSRGCNAAPKAFGARLGFQSRWKPMVTSRDSFDSAALCSG